jgi:hypothetical protein
MPDEAAAELNHESDPPPIVDIDDEPITPAIGIDGDGSARLSGASRTLAVICRVPQKSAAPAGRFKRRGTGQQSAAAARCNRSGRITDE